MQLTTEQLVGIILGIAFGSALVPRNDLCRCFSNLLGELGGYFASLLAMAAIGAIGGLLVHALINRYHRGHDIQA